MKKSIKKVLGIALALIMVLGAAMPQVTEMAYAGSQFDSIGVASSVVNYRHNGGHDYQVQDPDWVQVYCLDPAKAYSDKGANMNIRWKVDLKNNAWLLNSNQTDVNGSNKPNADHINRLVSILWKAQQMGANIEDTQKAVWWFVTQGADNNYAGNVSKYNNYIVKAAGDSGWAIPGTYELYLYAADNQAPGYASVQNMVRFTTDEGGTTPPPVEPNWEFCTQVNVNGINSTADTPATITLQPGQTEISLEILDKVQYKNMAAEAGHLFYTMEQLYKLNDDGTSEFIRWRTVGTGAEPDYMTPGEEYWINNRETVVDASGNGEWAYLNSTGMWHTLGPGTYYIVMSLYDSQTGMEMTHDGKGDNLETFIIKPSEEPPVEEKKGELSTTVEVNGSKGSETAEAKVTVPAGEKSIVTDVKDTIDYKNLVKGNTYKVQGTLMEVAEDGSTTEVAKSDAEDKVAEDVNGTWEITFKNVTLEVGKKYVVFESATPIKDAENNEITDGKTIEHNNPKDKAQTVVVEEEEPTEEPPKEEPPVPNLPNTGQPEEPTNNTPSNNPPQIPNTGTPSVPATGDAENIVIWLVLAATATFMTYTLMRLRRR